MQPVDATKATRSMLAIRNMATNEKTTSVKIELEPIPIVEPLPHYPLSANVTEMLAYIGELIETQRETSLQAVREENLAKARAEMQRLLDASVVNTTDASAVQINTSASTVESTKSVDSTVAIQSSVVDDSLNGENAANLKNLAINTPDVTSNDATSTDANVAYSNIAVKNTALSIDNAFSNAGTIPAMPVSNSASEVDVTDVTAAPNARTVNVSTATPITSAPAPMGANSTVLQSTIATTTPRAEIDDA